jgi:hypothetical protein
MWLDSAAHLLYTPTAMGERIVVARWHHHIHLIPGCLFRAICDRYEASLWRGTECQYAHFSYSGLPGLTCTCGMPLMAVTTTATATLTTMTTPTVTGRHD